MISQKSFSRRPCRRTDLSGAELLREFFGRAREDADIDADGGEGRPEFDAMRGKGGVGRQDSRRLADGAQAPDGILARRADLRVARLSGMSEARGEVGRADEDSVDARNGGNRFERLQRRAR